MSLDALECASYNKKERRENQAHFLRYLGDFRVRVRQVKSSCYRKKGVLRCTCVVNMVLNSVVLLDAEGFLLMSTIKKIVKFIILEVIASLLFIYIHFYVIRNIFTYPTQRIYSLISYTHRGDLKMSERQGDSVVDWLEIDLARLSGVERVTLINEIMDMLTAQELGAVRESADKKRQGKLKDARISFVAEMREKAEQLDLSLEEVLEFEGNKKTRKASSPRVKYRTVHGEWSGRGRVPVWLRELEAQGHKREDFLVKED